MEDTSDNDNRQNPRKHFTAIRQFKSGLPSIPGRWTLIEVKPKSPTLIILFSTFYLGIFALSKAEIKKDVREMERSMHSDTDSDSSVLSEDVLPSTYPVKPRKTPKGTVTQKPPAGAVAEIDPLEREYDSKMIEQTLVFLDSLKRNKKDLYNAEVERERLENQSMVSTNVTYIFRQLIGLFHSF